MGAADERAGAFRRGRIRDRHLIMVALVIQALCAGFFIADILSSFLPVYSDPISWAARELIQIGAACGLMLGFALGVLALFRARRRHLHAESQLRRASAAFNELLEEHFGNWALTPAEREVALFCLKGLDTAEIAGLRGTSEGTIKAQTAAIYRKAGVSGRGQLLAVFIEELMDGGGFEAGGMRGAA